RFCVPQSRPHHRARAQGADGPRRRQPAPRPPHRRRVRHQRDAARPPRGARLDRSAAQGVTTMQHTRLGRTGLSVSRLCLGTMTFGVQCDEETSVAILDRAFDAGVTFLDTADVYPVGGDLTTVGRTEEILGRWLPNRRDDVIVATKCFGPMSARPWNWGNSRKQVMDAVEGSLRRLNTDYIDLYQLHGPDPNTPIDETLHALDDLVHMGKVRYVGCSNFLAYQIALAVGRSDTL